MTNTSYPLVKWLLAIPAGALTLIMPNVPFILIAFVFILTDCVTAYQLARRVKKAGKARTVKIKSHKLWKAFITAFISAAAIVFAFVIEKYMLVMYDNLYLPNWTAVVICFIQGISILENISSCNGKRWALVLQKIVVDKTERHFDIDLSGLFPDEKEEAK